MSDYRARAELRFAELLTALSLVTDLGMGFPPGEAMRSCLLALGLARKLNLSERDAADVYYAALLRHAGCTATAHEEALHLTGDELATRPSGARTDFKSPSEILRLTVDTLRMVPAKERPRVLVRSFGPWGKRVAVATCETAATMARRIGMPQGVEDALYQIFERWDGKGDPRKLKGEAIALPARFAEVASQAVMFTTWAGAHAAREVMVRRSGRWLDPEVGRAFLDHGPALLAEIDAADAMAAVLEAEPEPVRVTSEADLDKVAGAFADMVDLKSPFTYGHSAGVAELAQRAARGMGLPDDQVRTVFRAALFHDLGRVGVPGGIWDKPGPLTAGEWERVRLHVPHGADPLSLTGPAPGAGGGDAPRAPERVRLPPAGVRAGHFDDGADPCGCRRLPEHDAGSAASGCPGSRGGGRDPCRGGPGGAAGSEAVGAVLEAAGQPVPSSRKAWPAGLSHREVEVLRLVARGLGNREIARQLFISPRTAEHHVQHIYTKIGMATRAGAAMFAMEHGLLAPMA